MSLAGADRSRRRRRSGRAVLPSRRSRLHLQTSDNPADQPQEGSALGGREPCQCLAVHRLGRRRRQALECARRRRQPDALRPGVGRRQR